MRESRAPAGRCLMLLTTFLLLAAARPVQAGVAVVGGLSREKVVELGKTYKGVIFIANPTDEPEQVKVYQTDYLFFSDGRTLYGEAGKAPLSNAAWISFSPSRLTIPAKESLAVDYAIKVPADETLTGTYWSVLMVEAIAESSPEIVQADKQQVGVGIRNVIRYAVQMITTVGDTGASQLRFPETRLLRENGRRILQVDIENTGRKWLRPFVWMELYDREGRFVGRFEGRRKRTFPGTSVREKIDLKGVPEGTYKALLVADGGGEAVFGVTHTLELKKAQLDE